jgi:K+ transporter
MLGIFGIYKNPEVLAAANPAFAIGFIVHHRLAGFVVLGAVFFWPSPAVRRFMPIWANLERARSG